MNKSAQLHAVALIVLGCALLPAPLRAQTPAPATSFAELPDRLPVEERVVLTLASGERLRAWVDAVETARLSIRGDGGPRWLQDHEIARIDRRTPDSILNGLLIGAASGAALFLAIYSDNALCEVNCQFVSGAFGLIGIGAGVGAGLDALVVPTVPVYAPRGSTQSGAVARANGGGRSGALAFRVRF